MEFLDYFLLLLTICVSVVIYYKWKFTYWSRKGLLSLPPTIPFGNLGAVILEKVHFSKAFQEIYRYIKSKGEQHGGIYGFASVIYIPVDLDLIKSMLQNDFQHFINHGTYVNEKNDPLSATLFNMEDDRWRQTRIKLTPTFTSGKMKMMFETIVDCTNGLRSLLEKTAKDKTPLDVKEIISSFTVDVIGSCAFGIECNAMNSNPQFREHGEMVFGPDSFVNFKLLVQFLIPRSVLNWLKFTVTPEPVTRFFTKMVSDTVEYREKNDIYRKDFLHLLLQLKNRNRIEDDREIKDDGRVGNYLTMNEFTSQCLVFFVAGFETSAITSTYALYELAKNEEIQEKLRREIHDTLPRFDNQLTYEAIMSMSYLDQIVQETLRMYPPVPSLFRKCNKDYPVPGTSVVIEKGTQVFIPIYAIQMDPEYYPEPEVFNPDRFTPENKKSRHPFTWLPFGEGPRMCIGLRFALLQIKVALITTISNYRVSINKKTKEPLEFVKSAVFLYAEGGIWLDLEKI